MQLSVTQEEKMEILIKNLHLWDIFSGIKEWFHELLNLPTIYEKVLQSVDIYFELTYNSNYDYDEYVNISCNIMFAEYEDYERPVYDVLELLLRISDAGVNEYTDFASFTSALMIEFIDRHIINELKKTEIPDVLQRIMIEYVF